MKPPAAWLEIFMIAAVLLVVMIGVMWAESSRRGSLATDPAHPARAVQTPRP